MSENQRIVFKTLLMSYFVIQKIKMGQNNKHCIDSVSSSLRSLSFALFLKYS